MSLEQEAERAAGIAIHAGASAAMQAFHTGALLATHVVFREALKCESLAELSQALRKALDTMTPTGLIPQQPSREPGQLTGK